jgi:SAM-dependent methyltransferase
MLMGESAPPDPRERVEGLSEVFRHPVFMEGTDEQRERIMHESSENRYEDEEAFPFENYFGRPIDEWVRGDLLDLGCFTGGRAAAWWERYKPRSVSGLDVDEVFIRAARRFAEFRGVPADFRVGFGERIPWPDDSFDTIITFDVFEHLRSVPATLAECRRVLRPRGRLLSVFPSHFQPIEHHLSLVTNTPFLQYMFKGETLIEAYRQILNERGASADWYGRKAGLEPWERGNTINGMTNRAFRRLVRAQGWEVTFQAYLPIGAVGRRAQHSPRLKLFGVFAAPLTHVPGFQEIVLHRLSYVLRRGA